MHIQIIPAIDIMGGKCVRLVQGDPKKAKIYFHDPLDSVKIFENQGAEILHLVDLDAALGIGQNIDQIERIIEKFSGKIQVGGGLRTLEKIDHLIKLGAHRVIIGTAAIHQPSLIQVAVNRYGSPQIAVAIDERNNYVTIKGWTENSKINYIEFAQLLQKKLIETVIFTSTGVDGTLKGPSFGKIKRLLKNVNLRIIASGGISRLEDLKVLTRLQVEGVIVGAALYEEKFTLEEALEAIERVS